MYEDRGRYAIAIQDFHSARNRAVLEEILGRLKGESVTLLPFDEVREKLKTQGSSDRGLHDIPLDAIVGSVGRYNDFTRSFLPRHDVNKDRWAKIKVEATGLKGLPPIEVYQIGETYFVKDGNHRVSVARELGASHIQAYVTEIKTRVRITPNIQPDELIIKAEYANFLENTGLDELRPDADLTVTAPGMYEVLLEHIDVHRYFMGIDERRDISYEEAVAHWYDTVYLPIVCLIQEQGILRDFPERTETDLYLWIMEHRSALMEELGWEIEPEEAAEDLVEKQRGKSEPIVAKMSDKLIDTITGRKFETGPPTGKWRKERLSSRRDERLFTELLVAISGTETGWRALEQAIVVAQREGAWLHGMHVVPSETAKTSDEVRSLKSEFERRCTNAGIRGEFHVERGKVAQIISDRSRWTDLVVTSLNFPPAPQPLARLSSGFRNLVQWSPRPILATPREHTQLDRTLLAYDGSPKSEEALFIAAYLAGRWNISLSVITVIGNGVTTRAPLEHAKDYLESRGVSADYHMEAGNAADRILQISEKLDINLILMGGYGRSPVLEVVLGSTVDQVLRESCKPMLICR